MVGVGVFGSHPRRLQARCPSLAGEGLVDAGWNAPVWQNLGERARGERANPRMRTFARDRS